MFRISWSLERHQDSLDSRNWHPRVSVGHLTLLARCRYHVSPPWEQKQRPVFDKRTICNFYCTTDLIIVLFFQKITDCRLAGIHYIHSLEIVHLFKCNACTWITRIKQITRPYEPSWGQSGICDEIHRSLVVLRRKRRRCGVFVLCFMSVWTGYLANGWVSFDLICSRAHMMAL